MDFFADSSAQQNNVMAQDARPVWRVLMVDDDPEVHSVTRLVLRDFEFNGRPLELVSAHSGAEARSIFDAEGDSIALALIDVVMETEHSGLELVGYLRNDCNIRKTRLVLRTGQAGQAPEDRVIREYDIDDYKEKTELTSQKLRTVLYSMLRAYNDLCDLERHCAALDEVLQACAAVQACAKPVEYAGKVLQQLTNILEMESAAFYAVVVPGVHDAEREPLLLMADADGVTSSGDTSMALLTDVVVGRIQHAQAECKSRHYVDGFVYYMPAKRAGHNVFYIAHNNVLADFGRRLLETYVHNIATMLENLNLFRDLQDASKELVYTLADAVEARSRETGAHVKRVAFISERLAELVGLPQHEIDLIRDASPLHDIGKVAIPDAILHKPGRLTKEEWLVMQTHVSEGVAILGQSRREIMRMGATIAGNHHERWDGNGYPQKLQGEQIPMAGRITALADVFDALGSLRSYKQPWSNEDIFELIKTERGRHFDPQLVDLFLENFSDFLAISLRYPDLPCH